MGRLFIRKGKKRYSGTDFTSAQLPTTRKEVFFDLFSHSIGKLFKLSGLCAIFALPAIIWIAYMSDAIYSVAKELATLSGIQYAIALNKGYALTNTLYFGLIPLLMIWGLGFAGAFRVIKKMVWGEGVLLSADFFLGIKDNYKQFLTWFFIIGVSLFIMVFNYNYSQSNYDMSFLEQAGIAVSIAQLVLVGLFSMFYLPQAVLYTLGFGAILKNSLLFLIKTFFKSIGVFALSIGIFAFLLLLPYNLAKIAAIAIFLVIGSVYTVIVWTLYTHSVFDKYINQEHHVEIYQKGLWKNDNI